ncbi:hypothetical protein GCM10023231_40030 [Olivibacter ginsenosidimutans]|uniref:Collagen-like protein n=1 Tax=Olivibacter ginsenosidimutans TaxID=1176537 RepID=A0ABP9CA28_9SPHI
MKTFIKHLLFFLLIMGSFNACKKGDIGPEGPQGIQGEQGEKGDKGDKGSKGDQGNANVITRTFTANKITWTSSVIFSTNYVVATLSVPEITADIVNNGAVMVYGGFFWESPWSALPLSFYETGKTNHFTYGIKAGSVTLRVHNSSNTAPSAPGIAFKVVVIAGKAATAAKNNQVDLNNYQTVKQFFKLDD